MDKAISGTELINSQPDSDSIKQNNNQLQPVAPTTNRVNKKTEISTEDYGRMKLEKFKAFARGILLPIEPTKEQKRAAKVIQ